MKLVDPRGEGASGGFRGKMRSFAQRRGFLTRKHHGWRLVVGGGCKVMDVDVMFVSVVYSHCFGSIVVVLLFGGKEEATLVFFLCLFLF